MKICFSAYASKKNLKMSSSCLNKEPHFAVNPCIFQKSAVRPIGYAMHVHNWSYICVLSAMEHFFCTVELLYNTAVDCMYLDITWWTTKWYKTLLMIWKNVYVMVKLWHLLHSSKCDLKGLQGSSLCEVQYTTGFTSKVPLNNITPWSLSLGSHSTQSLSSLHYCPLHSIHNTAHRHLTYAH